MRTTLTLDRDVAERVKSVTRKSGRPLKQIINEALRVGLDQLTQPTAAKPYRTKSRNMGLREGFQLDNVQELLSQIDGEDAPPFEMRSHP
jgi:hypothetical protein